MVDSVNGEGGAAACMIVFPVWDKDETRVREKRAEQKKGFLMSFFVGWKRHWVKREQTIMCHSGLYFGNLCTDAAPGVQVLPPEFGLD